MDSDPERVYLEAQSFLEVDDDRILCSERAERQPVVADQLSLLSSGNAAGTAGSAEGGFLMRRFISDTKLSSAAAHHRKPLKSLQAFSLQVRCSMPGV